MKRDDRARQIKGVVISTTFEMIRDMGIENVTARDVAEKSGYTVRTLYKHFRNMDELFWLTRNAVTADFAEHLQNRNGAETVSGGAVDQLMGMFVPYLDYFIGNPELYRFLNFYRLDADYKTGTAYHEQPEFPEIMKTAFGSLVSGGHITEPDLEVIPSILILTVQGLLTSLISGNEGLSAADARVQLENIIKFVLEKCNGKKNE